MSLLSLWSNRINTANSRKHQEFIGRLNSVNNKAELYQHLKEENGFVSVNASVQISWQQSACNMEEYFSYSTKKTPYSPEV